MMDILSFLPWNEVKGVGSLPRVLHWELLSALLSHFIVPCPGTCP